MSGTSEYRSYQSMKSRCYRKAEPANKYYKRNGIKVSASWLNSFKQFFKDLGAKPNASYVLDRIDLNGNYRPDNCRWMSKKEHDLKSTKERVLRKMSLRRLRK